MRACALLNLAVAVGFSAVALFAGCGSARPPAEQPDAPAPSEGESATPPAAEAQPQAASKGQDSRTTESIANEVRLHRDKARECYDQLQQPKKLPAGDLVIHFVLGPDGSVKETSLNDERSTLKDTELLECVAGVIKGIRFPRSSRGMETAVNYPFNFKPRGR